jgi:rare lipoprotein A
MLTMITNVSLTTQLCFLLGFPMISLMTAAPLAAAERGLASIYSYKDSKTASGERARRGGLTAAHRTLPFGTNVKVVNRRNGRTVVVRINDRGPFVKGRVIDVTPAAAAHLGFSGLAMVDLHVQ